MELQNADRPGAKFYYKNPAQHECVEDYAGRKRIQKCM